MKDLVCDSQDKTDGYNWGCSHSYGELVNSMEYEIVFDEHDNDYQGDSYYLLQDGERYGVLVFGWGSCSGCDALQACSSHGEVVELRDNLHEGITWHDTKEAFVTWVSEKDFETEWYMWSGGAGNEFVRQLKKFAGIEVDEQPTT